MPPTLPTRHRDGPTRHRDGRRRGGPCGVGVRLLLLLLHGASAVVQQTCPFPFDDMVYDMDAHRVLKWTVAESSLANNLNCFVYGTAATGEAVFMQLQSYVLESSYDFVYALNGATSAAPKIASITGTGSVSPTYCGSAPALGVQLQTDYNYINGGFVLVMWTQGWYCDAYTYVGGT